jgi:hypothetical protein
MNVPVTTVDAVQMLFAPTLQDLLLVLANLDSLAMVSLVPM